MPENKLSPAQQEDFEHFFGKPLQANAKGHEPALEAARQFGGWLRARRARAAKSRQDAAAFTKIDIERWDKIEQGSLSATYDEILRIADFLSVRRVVALGASGYTDQFAPDTILAQEMATCLAQLPPEKHEFFRETIRWQAHDLVEDILQSQHFPLMPDSLEGR